MFRLVVLFLILSIVISVLNVDVAFGKKKWNGRKCKKTVEATGNDDAVEYKECKADEPGNCDFFKDEYGSKAECQKNEKDMRMYCSLKVFKVSGNLSPGKPVDSANCKAVDGTTAPYCAGVCENLPSAANAAEMVAYVCNNPEKKCCCSTLGSDQ